MSEQLKLGITTIGDILLKNTVTQTEKGCALENIEITIPEYQRPYKWGPKNVNRFFDDINDAMLDNREVYRLGTLILYYNKDTAKYEVVDGQQRMITSVLLLKALGETPELAKVEITGNEDTAYNTVMNFKILERKAGNLISKKEYLDYLKNQCELIVVITESRSEAFQFFDSQNARGKKLYPHDLLKAYHLREMQDVDVEETVKTVKMWEDLNQEELSNLFTQYLYRLKEWIKGNKSKELNEDNIDMFKGISASDSYPYSRFYKGAYAYLNEINSSALPFVAGINKLDCFQINTPVIAGKPFFDYAKHYYDILKDIQNNNKYEGYLINDNPIVKTLDLTENKSGVGNGITRLMFDTAVLLYADRFCPERPSNSDIELLDQFVVLAFVWAYSLRAQYNNVGWNVAQNYIAGTPSKKGTVNAFNIYKCIAESDSPLSLMSNISGKLVSLSDSGLSKKQKNIVNKKQIDDEFNPQSKKDEAQREETKESEKIHKNYLHHFKENKFLEVEYEC